ncbi:MAG: thiamine phosphate synthase [Methanobrevibacter sp.]|nr:thiamine phosphate synthase [Methanobrevibacter sp.]
MNNSLDLSVYLVTNSDNKTKKEFLNIIEEAIIGGVTTLQIREKTRETKDFYNLALEVKDITDLYKIPLIVDDRIDVAMAIDADGVHIGQKDLPAKIVREIIGDKKILGVSAATVETAKTAEKDGADYIGTGAIFPTTTKEADCITINHLKNIVNSIEIPVVVIGGLDEKNIVQLSGTGIKGVSVVSAIMDAEYPKKIANKLKEEMELIIN